MKALVAHERWTPARKTDFINFARGAVKNGRSLAGVLSEHGVSPAEYEEWVRRHALAGQRALRATYDAWLKPAETPKHSGRINARTYYALGGPKNPKLWRRQVRGRWMHFYRHD